MFFLMSRHDVSNFDSTEDCFNRVSRILLAGGAAARNPTYFLKRTVILERKRLLYCKPPYQHSDNWLEENWGTGQYEVCVVCAPEVFPP